MVLALFFSMRVPLAPHSRAEGTYRVSISETCNASAARRRGKRVGRGVGGKLSSLYVSTEVGGRKSGRMRAEELIDRFPTRAISSNYPRIVSADPKAEQGGFVLDVDE